MAKRLDKNDATMDLSTSQLVPEKRPHIPQGMNKNDASMWIGSVVSTDDFAMAAQKPAPAKSRRWIVGVLTALGVAGVGGYGLYTLKQKPAASPSAATASPAPTNAAPAATPVAAPTAPADGSAVKPATGSGDAGSAAAPLLAVDAVSGADPLLKKPATTKKRPKTATKKTTKKKVATSKKKRRRR